MLGSPDDFLAESGESGEQLLDILLPRPMASDFFAGTIRESLAAVHSTAVFGRQDTPPIAVESIWAQPSAGKNEYIIDNVPFFTRDATLGDTVAVRREGGDLWYERTVHSSRSSLIRVVFFDRSMVKDVQDQLVSLGCQAEHFAAYNLLAVSVPSSTEIESVQDYLQAQESESKIGYEEAILRT